ncbi:hypothetical protein GUJ93_ZPchr0012g20844 [Zizania palustris]|uniref:Uncharacterized protein n=1 Tax=Zizania palustris TaxID=103762 RepID=A0A8J5WQ12_ZIZPA|nr:hypothetical protein GUJ93_ZPchr0012g20844 [Zizania palustris]
MDAMWRQFPPPAVNAGSLAKQKSPVRHDHQSTSKDAVKKPECKKFMYGVPTYLELLAHDSEGQYRDDHDEDADGEGFVGSLMSSYSRKRARSTTDTTISPLKKNNSLMLNMFQGHLARIKEEKALAEMEKQRQEEMQQKKKQREEEMEKKNKLRDEEKQIEKDEKHKKRDEALQDIDRCLDLAVEAGARSKEEEALAEMAKQRQEEMQQKKKQREEMEKKKLREEEKQMEKDEKQKKRDDALQDIDRCLDLAVEAGASYNTDEFYIATRLFSSDYNRPVFCKIKTKEDRLGWLKRCYQDFYNY